MRIHVVTYIRQIDQVSTGSVAAVFSTEDKARRWVENVDLPEDVEAYDIEWYEVDELDWPWPTKSSATETK